MAINETIVTGRKFRKCIDEATKFWQRFSFWSKAEDTEFDDGKNAETKLGAIDGITDSLASTSSRIAASAKSVNQLSNDLAFPDGVRFYPDVKDGVRGFNIDPARGADTFSPFRQKPILLAANINSVNPYSYICTNISGYKSLTEDNFFLVFKGINKVAQSISTDYASMTKNYSPTTGKLTVSQCYLGAGLKYSSGSNLQVSVTYDLYLIK